MRFFILFFAMIFPLFSQGQNTLSEIQYESGEYFRNSPRRSLPQVLGYDTGGGMYALQTRLKRTFGFKRQEPMVYTLQYYDEQLNLKETQKLDLKHNGTNLRYQFMAQLSGGLYLFTSYHNPLNNNEYLLAQKVKSGDLSLEEPLTIAEVENPDKNGFFKFQLSNGGSRLLVAYSRRMEEKNDQRIDLYVLDENLQKVWHKEDCLARAGVSFNVEQYRVDDTGNVYLLSTLFPDKRAEKRQGSPDYQYVLSSFRIKGQEQEDFGIRLKDKFITDLQIKLTSGNEIIGGGFYADEGSFSIKGSYFFTIDAKSNKVLSRSLKEFEPEFLSQHVALITAKKRKTRNQVRQYGFSLKDIFLRQDGSAVLLGEQYFVSSSTIFNRKYENVKSTYFYDFNDIVIINISPKGEIEWAQKVEKQQRSCDDAGLYSSFIPLLVKGDVFLFYNSLPENYSITKSKKGRRLHMEVAVVDRKGEITYPIERIRPEDNALIPKTAIGTGKSELVMLGRNKKKNCFVKVSISPSRVLSFK